MKSFAVLVITGLAAIVAAAPQATSATTSKARLSSSSTTPARDPASEACITTSTKSEPNKGCILHSTTTHYPSTVTLQHSVDCHGCNRIFVKTEPVFHCPIEIFTATATERDPTTTVQTVCKATPY